jgi:2',3'-cyclic-nucleotide 2'-phosphodiesterase (5'-nucleotidase family)
LSSTGTKFQNIGLLTLSTDGKFSSRLVSYADLKPDAKVQAYVDGVKEKTLAEGKRIVGHCDVDLPMIDASGATNVRCGEMPIGNFCADAFRLMLHADVAMINGGGIRAGLTSGEIMFNDLLAVFPFNNTVCTATFTGQQLLDALEMSVRCLPNPDGSFMQVSGMTFEVDFSIPSPVVLDEYSLFSHVSPAPRRVSHLHIWDKIQGAYIPVDTDRTYVLASFDYQLKEFGCNAIFRYAMLKDDNLGQDVEVLISYLTQMLGGRIGSAYAAPEGRIRIHE